MKKRILSVLLAALMVLGSVGTFAFGVSAADEFTISVVVGKVEGNKVHVDINFAGNAASFAAIQLSMNFDKTVLKPVSYDTKEVDYEEVMDTNLGGTVVTNLAEPGVDLASLDFVSYAASQASNYKRPEGKLMGITFEVLDITKSTDLTLSLESCANQAYENVTAKLEDGFFGVPTLDNLSMDNAEFVYDGTPKSLTINNFDASVMTVTWTNNGKTDVGEYDVKAVVEQDGYASKELTATLKITPKTVELKGVEVHPVIGDAAPEFKKCEPYAMDGTKNVALNVNDVKVVKNGDKYNVEGVTPVSANYILVTTIAVKEFAADQTAAFIAEVIADAGVPDTSKDVPATVKPQLSELPAVDVDLPYGMSVSEDFEVDVEGIIAEDRTITRPAEKTTVGVTYKVLDKDGKEFGEFTVYYEITPEAQGDELAALMLYYYKKLQASKTPVETVTASVAAGSVAAGTTVELKTATEGATIYYTTDGTPATVLSKVYTGPITISADMTINAIAKKTGMKTSTAATFAYTVAENSIALKADADTIKYMDGRGDKFEPKADATRYEVIAALANVFDIKTTNAPKTLSDVSAENKALVDLFTAAGIIDGFSDNTFRGNDAITREQIAKIICVMMNLDDANAKDAGFKDVSGWSVGYINACANAGYVQGKGDGEFAPKENITRAQLATLINNITGAKAGNSCSYSDVESGEWYFGAVAAAAK